MYEALMGPYHPAPTPIPSGTVLAIDGSFAATGGAAMLVPVMDTNGYFRNALGRFARDPNALVDESVDAEPHGNSFASPRTTYLYRLTNAETGEYLKTGSQANPIR
jgi:hypothetical protein